MQHFSNPMGVAAEQVQDDAYSSALQALETERELSTSISGHDLSITWPGKAGTSTVAHWDTFIIELEGEDIVLAVNAPLIPILLQSSGFKEDPDDWSNRTRQLVATHLLHPFLDTLAGFLEVAVKIRSYTNSNRPPPREDVTTFGFQTKVVGENSITMLVAGSASVRRRLIKSLPLQSLAEDHDAPDVSLSISLRSPNQSVDVGSLMRLKPTDVILLDSNWSLDSQMYVYVDNRKVGNALLDSGGEVHLTSELSNLPMELDKAMSENVTEEGPDPLQETLQTAANIPVSISIEFTRAEITIQDLLELRPGSMIPIVDDRPNELRLYANGKLLAIAEHIEFDGQVAARILKLSNES